MLVRLLQQVSAIEFVPEVAPRSVVPPGYADSPGSDGTDRVWMATHLTSYAKVCVCVLFGRALRTLRVSTGIRVDYGSR